MTLWVSRTKDEQLISFILQDKVPVLEYKCVKFNTCSFYLSSCIAHLGFSDRNVSGVCMPIHRTYHKCSTRGPEEVLCLFEANRNPRWLGFPLIVPDIFNFSRITLSEVTRLDRNVL